MANNPSYRISRPVGPKRLSIKAEPTSFVPCASSQGSKLNPNSHFKRKKSKMEVLSRERFGTFPALVFDIS
jgi:hypothetical protein